MLRCCSSRKVLLCGHLRSSAAWFGLVWFGLLGFNASATARVISRQWNDDDDETTDLQQVTDESPLPHQGPFFLFSTYRKLRWDELSKLFLLIWAHAHCEQCLGFFVLQEPDLTWDGFSVSMRPYPWTLLRANTPSVLRAAYLHNFREWSLRKGRWVLWRHKTDNNFNNLSA